MKDDLQADEYTTAHDDPGCIPKNLSFEEYEDYIKKQFESIDNKNDARRAASIYIVDNRSIGNYFEHSATVHGSVSSQYSAALIQDKNTSTATNISADFAEKINHVYIHRENSSEAKDILFTNNLLIIQGEPDHGKKTMAFALLMSAYDVNSIYEISGDITDYTNIDFIADSAYVLDASVSHINDHRFFGMQNLLNIKEKLVRLRSYLVLTVDNGHRFAREVDKTLVIHLLALPDHKRMLTSHLEWYLIQDTATYDCSILVDSHEVSQILSNKLLPGEIDQLAFLLSRVARDEFSLASALSSFGEDIREKIDAWFHKNHETTSRVGFIIVGIVNGCKLSYFDEITRRFMQVLSLESNSDDDYGLGSFFSDSRSKLLKTINCSLGKSQEKTPYGLIPIETITLDNPRFQSAILSYVWHEYPQLKEPLLALLSGLGEFNSSDIRLKVASAIGDLCKYDLKNIFDSIIYKWASSGSLNLQSLAALALYVPLCNRISTGFIIGVLENWSHPQAIPSLRITAILAYRNFVSNLYPGLAIKCLFDILVTSSGHIFYAATEAICDFFDSGKSEPSRYLVVLQSMCKLCEEEMYTPRHRASCYLFGVLVLRAGKHLPDSSKSISSLIWLLLQEQLMRKSLDNQTTQIEFQPCIAFLTRVSLSYDKRLRKIVLGQMAKWLMLADDDKQFFSPTANLIYKVYISESVHGQERIIAFLKKCRNLYNSESALEIFQRLNCLNQIS